MFLFASVTIARLSYPAFYLLDAAAKDQLPLVLVESLTAEQLHSPPTPDLNSEQRSQRLEQRDTWSLLFNVSANEATL